MKNHFSRRSSGGMQIINAKKDKLLKDRSRRKRSTSRRRHARHTYEEGFSSSDGDIYDIESGKSRRHHRRVRRKSRDRHQSGEVSKVHHELVPVRDFTLQLKSPSHLGNQNHLPSLFMLPPGSKLSPRSDVWLLVSISSVTTLSSIALSSTSTVRTAPETTSLVLSSVLFAISTLVGAGYRHAPFRQSLTCTSEILCLKSTKETIVALLCLCLAVVTTTIVMDPSLYIASGGNGIWNANIFFAAWGAFYTCLYLVADLITTSEPSGLIDSRPALSRSLSYLNSVAKVWWMLLGSNVALVGVLFEFFNTVCASPLSTSHVCKRAFGAALLPIFSMLINLAALAVYRMALLGEMRRSRLQCFNGSERAYRMSRRVGFVLSLLVVALQSTTVAIVSSPSGPGLGAGSMFLTAWLSFGLSLVIMKAYMESFCLPKENLNRPKDLDDSLRTFGTIGTFPTDIDDSCKLTDEDKEPLRAIAAPQQYLIEQQRPLNHSAPAPHQEPVERVPSEYSSRRSQSKPMSSRTGSTRVSTEPPGVKALITSSNQPMVFTRAQCDVSTLGNGTQEPVGLKSGSSLYSGVDPVSLQGSPQYRKQPTTENIDENSLPFMYPVSVATKSEGEEERMPPTQEKGVKGLQRRSSYCSIPSLPVLMEGSIESSSREKTNSSGSCKQKDKRHKSKRSTNSKCSKISKVSKSKAKHKFERRGSDGSSTISDPKTIVEVEFKLPQSHANTPSTVSTTEEFSIVCDSKSIVTEITTEGFELDEGHGTRVHVSRHPPRLPTKNPLYNGSDGSSSSGMPTPRLNALNSSVDDLVASALNYARKSRNDISARALSTSSPTPSSSSSYLKSEYMPQRARIRESMPKSHQKKKVTTPRQRSAIAKARRRGSVQSLYSTSNSGDEPVDAGMNFAC